MAQTISPKRRVAVLSDEQALEDGLNNDFVLPSLFKINSKGGKYNIFGINGVITSAEADDAINRWTTPTTAMEDALAVFVNAEVANGNWGTNASNYTDSLYDCFWLFGGVNSDVNALTDLHQVLKLTAINDGATRVTDGWSFDGVNDSIDSAYNPNTLGVNYQLNDCVVGVFLTAVNKTGGAANPNLFANGSGSSRAQINALYDASSTQTQLALNDDADNNVNIGREPEADELWLISRQDTTNKRFIVDGVDIGGATEITTSIGNSNFFIGSNELSANFFDGTIAAFMATGAIGFDQSGFNTNLRIMLTSLGVLP